MNLRPAPKIQTFSHSPSQLRGKTRLFQGLDDTTRGKGGAGSGVPKETFVPRKSIKTLIIAPKSSAVRTRTAQSVHNTN